MEEGGCWVRWCEVLETGSESPMWVLHMLTELIWVGVTVHTCAYFHKKDTTLFCVSMQGMACYYCTA